MIEDEVIKPRALELNVLREKHYEYQVEAFSVCTFYIASLFLSNPTNDLNSLAKF